MKKAYFMLFIMLFALIPVKSVYALEKDQQYSIGDIAGSFQKSNAKIVIILKDYERRTIPVYEVNDELCICVEDLQYYGYKMTWDQKNRTTSLTFSDRQRTGTTHFVKSRGNILYSDIKVFIDGIEVNGYNIGGYTLVKICDLQTIPDLYFWRDYGEQEYFQVKGKILLPQGDVAPKAGLNGKIIKYDYGYKGSPEKVSEISFYIPENKNYCDYTTTITPFQFLGYELDDQYGYYNGSLFEESGKPLEHYKIYTTTMNDYRVNYDDFNIYIYKTAQLSGKLTINHLTNEYPGQIRTIYILAEEINGSGEIMEAITVPTEQTEINYSMPVIADEEYNLKFYATRYASITSQYHLWAGPAPPLLFSGYYSSKGFVPEKSQGDILMVGKPGIQNVNVVIEPSNILSEKDLY
ncbi:hypothetical protein [Desulforamulus ruminis]|uniref:hypothetical protein n=1 Tax=Desulforamulus ruminis TaxID=1564 RepID=UPI002353CD20|nr:hypothetical protein [Desulforamulus ruminis]